MSAVVTCCVTAPDAAVLMLLAEVDWFWLWLWPLDAVTSPPATALHTLPETAEKQLFKIELRLLKASCTNILHVHIEHDQINHAFQIVSLH